MVGISISILSGLLLYASFPPLDLWFLAWIALVPLLTWLNRVRYGEAFLLGFLMGIVLCGLHVRWVNEISGFPFVAFLVIVLYSGLFFGLFGFFFTLILRRTGWPRLMAAPILWVAIEFIRSNLSFLAIPWFLLGQSQHENLPILQMASVTSVYGISFFIVFVNAALSEGFLWILSRRMNLFKHQPSSREVVLTLVVALVTVLLVYLWGQQQIRMMSRDTEQIITVSLIQGNIPQDEKWNSRFREKVLKRYRELSLKASQEDPQLMIWPETATPGYLKSDLEIHAEVKALVLKTRVPLLLGSASGAKIGRKMNPAVKNSAFLLDKNGKIVGEYDKMRLLPFGEYLPLQGKFPWPQWLVPDNGIFIPGTHPTLFQLSDHRFGVVICWESLFPDLFRKFVGSGAEFMVNLTNEADAGRTEASRQFLSMSVFRAVENRVALLRSANTGISSLVDPLGRVRERVRDEEGNNIMVTGILTVSVPGPGGPTFYTRHGDVFALACIGAASIFLISALLPIQVRRFSNDEQISHSRPRAGTL